MSKLKELNVTEKAQLVSAVLRALSFSWVELPGCEIDLLLETVSGLSDDVTAHLINESGEVSHA